MLFQPNQTRIAPEQGALAPPLDTADLNGMRVSLTALRGRPIILNFWASWCAPCLREMPLLEAISRQYPELTVIGINANEPASDFLGTLQQTGVTYRIIPDYDGRWLYAYQVRTLPVTLFVDRDGVIRRRLDTELSATMVAEALTAIQ
jgi:thiol-disulfide isomerase/thioredoxin